MWEMCNIVQSVSCMNRHVSRASLVSWHAPPTQESLAQEFKSRSAGLKGKSLKELQEEMAWRYEDMGSAQRQIMYQLLCSLLSNAMRVCWVFRIAILRGRQKATLANAVHSQR